MDLSASKQFRKCQNKFSHELIIQALPAFWIGIEKTVKHSLGNDIVEFLEKLLFCIFSKLPVFDKSKWYKVSCNPIKQKLLVLLKFWLRVTHLANNIPKRIRDQSICMFKVKQVQPVLLLVDWRQLNVLYLWKSSSIYWFRDLLCFVAHIFGLLFRHLDVWVFHFLLYSFKNNVGWHLRVWCIVISWRHCLSNIENLISLLLLIRVWWLLFIPIVNFRSLIQLSNESLASIYIRRFHFQ